jgi:hypothetical protein
MRQSIIFGLVFLFLMSSVLAIAPVTQSSNITPVVLLTNETVIGFCNATDADTTNIWYETIFYIDGVANQSSHIEPTGIYAYRNFSTYQGGSGTSSPTDIAQNASHTLIASTASDSIYKYYNNGTWVSTTDIGLATFNIFEGITFNGTDVWVLVNNNSGYESIMRLNGNLTTSSTWFYIPAVGTTSSYGGLTTNGTHLFIGNINQKAIYIYRMNGTYEGLYNLSAQGISVWGVKHDGSYLWISDNDYNLIRRINKDTGIYDGISFASYSNSSNFPHGLEKNTTHFSIIDGQTCDHDQVFIYNATYVNPVTQGILTNAANLSSNITEGGMDLILSCRAYDGTSYSSWLNSSFVTVYDNLINLQLIDEIDGTLFNFGNLTSARMYYNETHYIDLKTTNITNFNYAYSDDDPNVWFEFANDYYLVLRYFDFSLFEDDSGVRICVNKHTVEEVQNTLISASQTPAKIRNVFSNCYIVGDYTRFAYQNALSLRFFTIDAIYELQTYSDGAALILAYVDGGISTYYNLDTLLFNQNAYNVNIMNPDLTASAYSSDTIHIKYQNPYNDNIASTLSIYDLNSSTLLYSSTPATPNAWDVYYNYTLLGFSPTNETIFKVVVNEQKLSSSNTLVIYVKPNGAMGTLPNGVAFAFSVFLYILAIGGLSFNYAFGFVGIFLILGALIVTAFAVGSNAILMLQTIELLSLIFIIIYMVKATGEL